jgi:methylmalonyl-CoA/ethylmalonyl-CoA epimerase
MIKKLDHVAIAVFDLEKKRIEYERVLGLTCLGEETVEEQKVRVLFFDAGNLRIELMEPLSEDSPISLFLTKRGEGIHHLSYEVEDIHACIRQLRSENIRLIHEEPVSGSGGSLIVFAHPKSLTGVLTEFVQKK